MIKPFEKEINGRKVPNVLLNPLMVEEMKDDIKNFNRMLQMPNLQDRQGVSDRIKRMEKQLEEEVADGRLTREETDKLAREEVRLREKITHGMLDEETMRKCPSSAPQDHIQWENDNMSDILRWKNIRQQLDPQNPEASNLERYRPRGAQGYGYRADAVISGKMSYGETPKENWDQAFKKDPAEAIADTLQASVKTKREWTPEQREAAGQRLRDARAKKAAEKSGDALAELG